MEAHLPRANAAPRVTYCSPAIGCVSTRTCSFGLFEKPVTAGFEHVIGMLIHGHFVMTSCLLESNITALGECRRVYIFSILPKGWGSDSCRIAQTGDVEVSYHAKMKMVWVS